jgi:hypothetical protein
MKRISQQSAGGRLAYVHVETNWWAERICLLNHTGTLHVPASTSIRFVGAFRRIAEPRQVHQSHLFRSGGV